MCSQLDACQLLPSSLGTNFDECQERCERSRDEVQRRAIDCTNGASGSDWCGPGSKCLELASCVAEGFEATHTLGRGSVEFPVSQLCSTSVDNPSLPAVSEPTCTDESDLGCDATTAEWCEAFGATEVEYVVDSFTGASLRVRQQCSVGLSSTITVTSVPAGLALVSIKLRGVLPSDASGEGGSAQGGAGETSDEAERGFCRTFYARHHMVVAANGTDQTPRIDLGSVHDPLAGSPCEEGEEACTDGVDNDGNGKQDADEEACSAFFANEAEPPP